MCTYMHAQNMHAQNMHAQNMHACAEIINRVKTTSSISNAYLIDEKQSVDHAGQVMCDL